MNRNRKNSFLFVVLLSILSLCLFDSHMAKAEGAEDYVVEIDQNGNLLKGRELNSDKPIVRPAYQGSYATIYKDVIGPKGYFTGYYDSANHNATIKHKQQYVQGANLIVQNLGQYNGKKIALKITFLATGTTGSGIWKTNLAAHISKDGSVGVELGTSAEDVPIQYQLVYDEPGYPVVQNIYLDLPNVFTTGPTTGLRHPAINISSSNLKKAFISVPSSSWNQNIQRSYSLVSKTVGTKNTNFLNGEFSTLNNMSPDPNVSIVSNNNEPTVLILKSVQATIATMTVFKSDMKVPYIPTYLPIRANGEGNSDKLEAKYDIGQTVVDAYPNYLPESLKIVAEDTEGYFANLTSEALTFTDKDGKEITDLISVEEISNGKLEMTLPKASLEKLKANQVNIKLSFDELNREKLLSNYNASEKLYKVPLTFYNIRNAEGKEVESEKTKVEASISPNIYGEAKPTKVSLGSSSSDLNVVDLIKNAVTTIPDDSLKLSIVGSQLFDEFKTYTVNVKIESTKTPSLTKTVPVPVQVEEPLEEGWEDGTENDFILDQGYKLEWAKYYGDNKLNTAWWYTYQGSSWIRGKNIETGLIINGNYPEGTSNHNETGFLWANGNKSRYTINKEKKSLKRTFIYLNKYRIDIVQSLLENHAASIDYFVQNLTEESKLIGVNQFADVLVGSDHVPVTPINNFKGINLTYGKSSLSLIPSFNMPNWAAGHFSSSRNFALYDSQDAWGRGWETGMMYRGSGAQLLVPPLALTENKGINVGDSAVTIKNGGVPVAPDKSVSFSQILKYGDLIAPKVTLDQSAGILYNDEAFELTGTILDEDNKDYRLYLERDDEEKTLVQLEDYKNVPYNEKQSYKLTLKGNDFSIGEHNLSIIGIDEYGTRSLPQKLKLTIYELEGTPIVQKVKLTEQISQTDISALVKDIKGDQVKLKESLQVDSSKVGFQWVWAILIDSNLRELAIKLPVNVYNPESTIISDENGLALDAPNVDFELTTVRQAEKDKKLDELVTQKVNPMAWDLETGARVYVSLIKNGIKPIFGNYTGIFEADDGVKLQKEIQISVGGELKFKELPSDLVFKKSKLGWGHEFVQRSQADWKIEIENTIGSKWFLKASASPFENQEKEQLKHGLIFKNKENQVMEISSDGQLIAMDDGEIYRIIQWEKTDGLLVKLNPAAKIGMYQGEIIWELTDAP